MIKLIATDMDGTLLNDSGNMNEKMIDIIHSLDKKGIKFAAASGRFYSQLSKNFEKINSDMIFIAHNGALIKYNNGGDTLYSNSIDKKEIDHVIKLNPQLGEELFLAGENKAYIINPSGNMLNEFNSHHVPVVTINSFSQVRTPIYKITYYMAEGVNSDILEYLGKNLNNTLEYVVSGDKWIDIMNKGISKGSAINAIQAKFKIEEKNTIR
mgnify:FL=1